MTNRTDDVSETWDFDRLEPGTDFGTMSLPIGSEDAALWSGVFGGPMTDPVPASLLLALLMRAYLRLLHPRPAGNIHASQDLHFTGIQVRSGDVLEAGLKVQDRFLKKERRWVVFRVGLSLNGETVLTGDITSIWAR